jgi:capsular exopolysaccharide synthesis family protein
MNLPIHAPAIGTSEQGVLNHSYSFRNEMRLRDLWDILARRKKTVVGILLVCLAVSVLDCAFGPRRYRATAELQIGRETDNNLGLQAEGNQGPPADTLAEDITLQTQATILQSETLALQVISDLGLESTHDFRSRFNANDHLLALFALNGPPDPANATLEESPRRRARALETFNKNLQVSPVAGTRLIQISYLSDDPQLAAQIVNHLASSLVDYNFQIRHDTTSHTAQWLTGQMADLRRQSEDLQAKVVQLQRESGVFSLGATDGSGREQIYSTVLDKLQQSTTTLSQAEENRIAKAAIYQVTLTGDPEAVSQLSGNNVFSSSAGLDASLSLIQSMRMQEAVLRGQIGEMTAKFGPAYPKLSEVRSHLDALDDSIHAEVSRLSARAKNDYKVAQQVEANARQRYMDQKHQADLVNDKTIEYMIARKEAEESQNLYESLFRELKESDVLAGFRASNISLVDSARVPATPAKPKLVLYLTGALAVGLFLGLGTAFAEDNLDTKLHDVAAIQSELGQVPLVAIPYYKSSPPLPSSRRSLTAGKGLGLLSVTQLPLATEPEIHGQRTSSGSERRRVRMPALEDPHSAFVESLRSLRTSLLLSKGKTPPQVILVTSATPAEGKTMLSANFAAVLAQQRKKVLLVDADLRNPSLERVFDINGEPGLSGLLGGADRNGSGQSFEDVAGSAVVAVPSILGLYVVPSGRTPDRPAELLSSDRMAQAIAAWRKRFDFIVIDASPVLPVTDAVILSGIADCTLLTARFQAVNQQAVLQAWGMLRLRTDPGNVELVLNAVPPSATGHYSILSYSQFSAT